MKTLLFSAALGLGLLFSAGLVTRGGNGGSTTPKGEILDIATRGGNGGSTTPKGEILDIAERGGNGGSTTPKGEILDLV